MNAENVPAPPSYPPPKTKPWFLSKRVLCLTMMFVARIVPAVWHSPMAQTIADWLLNLAGIGLGGLMVRDSGTRITLHDKRE